MPNRQDHAALLALLALAGCASTSQTGGAATPDYRMVVGETPPPRARLYTDCIAQAIGSGGVDKPAGEGRRMLRFACSGAPAQALFLELGPWSARIGSQWSADGRVWRSTTKMQHDLVGLDHCSAVDATGADARCSVTLNVGEFLTDGR